MAGGRVHESGPFEARQVHEERQGPVRGTEGAWSVPSPSLCVGTCMGGDLNRGDQIWGITPGGFTSGSSWISTQADRIWICGYSTLCEIASFSGRSHLLEIASQIQSRDMMADGCYAAQGVDEHAALQGPQVRRAQLGQLDDVLFERRAHLLQQIRAHGVRQDAWCAPRRTRHDLGGHTTISTNEPMPAMKTRRSGRVLSTRWTSMGAACGEPLQRFHQFHQRDRSAFRTHARAKCPSDMPERYA